MMIGEIDEVVDALMADYQASQLAQLGEVMSESGKQAGPDGFPMAGRGPPRFTEGGIDDAAPMRAC
jgi:hypothetical protein